LLGAIGAGSLDTYFGARFWCFVAKWIGRERRGAWLKISHPDIERAEAWFDQWGGAAVLLGRVVPGIRTLISVPAGSAVMPAGRFCVDTAVGIAAWTTMLATLGYWLAGNYEGLVRPLSWVSYLVVGSLLAWWLWRLAPQKLLMAQ
jgi:membrane protein DedA with SNARE-associated domain